MNNAEEAVEQSPAPAGADGENATKKRRRRRRGKRNDRQGADGQQGTEAEAYADDTEDGDEIDSPNQSNLALPAIAPPQEQTVQGDAPQQNTAADRRRERNKRRKERNAANAQQAGIEKQADRSNDAGVESSTSEKSDTERPNDRQNNKSQDRGSDKQDKSREPRGPRGSVLQRRAERLGNSANRMPDEAEQPVRVYQPPVNVNSVDSYISHLRGWQKEVVTSLRNMIRNSSSEFEETIAWSQPVYNLNGPVCYIKAFSEHINFGFWRGVELDDPEGLLVGDMTYMRHVTIRGAQDVRRDRFENFVRQAARLNKDKGDPTSL